MFFFPKLRRSFQFPQVSSSLRSLLSSLSTQKLLHDALNPPDVARDPRVDTRNVRPTVSSIADDADGVLTTWNPVKSSTAVPTTCRTSHAFARTNLRIRHELVLKCTRLKGCNSKLSFLQDLRGWSSIFGWAPANSCQVFPVKKLVVLHESVWQARRTNCSTVQQGKLISRIMSKKSFYLNLM